MIIRSLFLLLPLAIWTIIFINTRISRREITASFLGFVWAFLSSLILNVFMLQQNIWHISLDDNLFYGIPLDWIFSQAIIIGALIPLLRLSDQIQGWHLRVRNFLQFIFIFFIYSSAGLILIEIQGVIIILSIFFLCAGPAMLLSDHTAYDTHIRSRSFLQAIAWAGLLLWMFPSSVFHLTPDSWQDLLQRDLIITILYGLPMILPTSLIFSALYQFAIEGDGTAFPYDPPKTLVTGGIYQYISNPMQLGICLMMGWWGFMLNSVLVSISALIAFILFMVFKDVCNGSCAIGKGNPLWEAYQKTVPKWIPRAWYLKPTIFYRK